MRLDGIHHVTCITGDAPGNVDFYTRVLGLRLVVLQILQKGLVLHDRVVDLALEKIGSSIHVNLL